MSEAKNDFDSGVLQGPAGMLSGRGGEGRAACWPAATRAGLAAAAPTGSNLEQTDPDVFIRPCAGGSLASLMLSGPDCAQH